MYNSYYIYRMKKIILILLVVVFSSCKKNDISEATLIGTWNSSAPILQFNITNLEGNDKPLKFIKEGDYLIVNGDNFNKKYLIRGLTKNELALQEVGTTTDIFFFRVK